MSRSSRHYSDGGRRQGKAPEKSNFAQTCNLLSQYIKEKGSLRDLNLEIGGKIESLEAIVKHGSSSHSGSAASTTMMSVLTDQAKSAHPPSTEQPPSMAALDSSINREDASCKPTSQEPKTADPKTAQLTIFYSGRVLVFDDYPANKAKELVAYAKKDSSQILSHGISSNTYVAKPSPGVIAVASTSSAREGLPPRPLAANGSQLKAVGISPNTCKENTNAAATGGAEAPSSTAEKRVSPQPEGNNSSDLPIARRSSLHRFLEKRKDRSGARGPYQIQEQPPSSSKGDAQLELKL